jgi:hypothetical protein
MSKRQRRVQRRRIMNRKKNSDVRVDHVEADSPGGGSHSQQLRPRLSPMFSTPLRFTHCRKSSFTLRSCPCGWPLRWLGRVCRDRALLRQILLFVGEKPSVFSPLGPTADKTAKDRPGTQECNQALGYRRRSANRRGRKMLSGPGA